MNNIETLQELGKGYASLNFFSYEQKEDFLDINMKQVEAFIKELEEKIQVKFTMTDLLRLTIKYAIAISRMKKGHYASIKEQTLKDLKALNKFHSLEEIRERMIIQFQLDQLPDAELAYLFGITIVAKTHFEDTVWNINKKMMVINKIVAQEIIELTRENYHIDNEITFFNGLVHHLKSVTNKIKYGLDFHNESVEEVKRNHQDAFAIALRTKSIFEEFYNHDIPIEEVTYIALHIAAAIERSKKPIKTYVMYHTSYSEIKLLIEFLKNNFNKINIIKIIPISMVQDIHGDEIELLITTKQLKQMPGCPSIVLPTVLLSGDIMAFTKYIRELYEECNKKKLKKYHN